MVSQLSLSNVMSYISNLRAQPCHTPTSDFTLTLLRHNKPFHFTVRPHENASRFTFYSPFICREDLISSLLSTHKVSISMGTQSAPLRSVALRPVPFVARDNSCLYLWQANRLIKGSHVWFCAWYLALSKHGHISTPQPVLLQHFLPYCGGRPWQVEPTILFFFFFSTTSSDQVANCSQRMHA